MIKEFRDFLMKGNLLEIAVALILALAFKSVVDSLVADIFTPIIAAIFSEPNFDSLVLDIGDGQIRYGTFLNTVIAFLIVGLVLFLVVKAYNKAVSLRGGGEGLTEEIEDESTEVILLRQIRDQLANTATIQLPRSQ